MVQERDLTNVWTVSSWNFGEPQDVLTIEKQVIEDNGRNGHGMQAISIQILYMQQYSTVELNNLIFANLSIVLWWS